MKYECTTRKLVFETLNDISRLRVFFPDISSLSVVVPTVVTMVGGHCLSYLINSLIITFCRKTDEWIGGRDVGTKLTPLSSVPYPKGREWGTRIESKCLSKIKKVVERVRTDRGSVSVKRILIEGKEQGSVTN